MERELINLLKELTNTPSPSGFEFPVQNILKMYIEPFVDECYIDIHGNLVAYKKGLSNQNLMLIAHSDEIGFMVKYIDEVGFIRFSKIGGIDVNLLQGLKVTIFHYGEKIQGLIGKKPIHLKIPEQAPIEIGDLWIDIGASSKEDAEKMVSVGDIITFESSFNMLPNNLIVCKSADDKVGILVMVATLKSLSQCQPEANLYIVSSVQEEIGLRGAVTATYNINPDICIAIDVTHATDFPNANKNIFGDIKLNSGVVIPIGANFNNNLQTQLKQIAVENNIKYQIEALPNHSGTDANAVQISRGGVCTGLLSIPCRYMHSPIEVVSMNDIDTAINILTNCAKKDIAKFLTYQIF